MKRIFLLLTLSLISCNSNPTDVEENFPFGRRNYVWTVDSVGFGNLAGRIELLSICGSNTKLGVG